MSISPNDQNIGLREYLERIIDERDKQYDSRFRAAEIAVSAALAAQEKGTREAFIASEKAIVKSDEAQNAYNVAHNDISYKMDQQAAGMIPRPEALGLFKSGDDKLEAMRLFFESKIETRRTFFDSLIDSLRTAFDKDIDNIQRDIASLRETQSEAAGSKTSIRDAWGYFVGAAGVALAIIFHFVH